MQHRGEDQPDEGVPGHRPHHPEDPLEDLRAAEALRHQAQVQDPPGRLQASLEK